MSSGKPSPELVAAVSVRVGLSGDTVTELLTKGWSFVDELGSVPRWESPITQLTVSALAHPVGVDTDEA